MNLDETGEELERLIVELADVAIVNNLDEHELVGRPVHIEPGLRVTVFILPELDRAGVVQEEVARFGDAREAAGVELR